MHCKRISMSFFFQKPCHVDRDDAVAKSIHSYSKQQSVFPTPAVTISLRHSYLWFLFCLHRMIRLKTFVTKRQLQVSF